MPSETWRIDTGDRVREVVVTSVHRGLWSCEDGPRETTPVAAVRAYAHFDGRGGMAIAPGEMTRAELAAQLATATASVRQLRADVELATAQRDAEVCRADNAEAERDDLAATLETRTAEHALAVARVRELEARLTAARKATEDLPRHLGATWWGQQLRAALVSRVSCPACNGRGVRLYGREVEDGCDECEATGYVRAEVSRG